MRVPTPHTPEPWEISTGAYGALHVGPARLDHPGRARVEYALERGHNLLAQRAADAVLIKAAPKLLAALQALVWQLERDDGIEWEEDSPAAEMVRQARIAIAEARGGAA